MIGISLPVQEMSCSGWSIFGYQNPVLLVNFMLSKPPRWRHLEIGRFEPVNQTSVNAQNSINFPSVISLLMNHVQCQGKGLKSANYPKSSKSGSSTARVRLSISGLGLVNRSFRYPNPMTRVEKESDWLYHCRAA